LSQPRATDLAAAHRADSAPLAVLDNAAQAVRTEVANAAPVRTDDTLRSVAVAQERREEAQELAQGKVSLQERLRRVVPPQGAGVEASARLAEPRAPEPGARGIVGSAFGTGAGQVVQDERMIEGGREVRRRIYRVDSILVTLDERLPSSVGKEERRAHVDAYAAPPEQPARDSARGSTNTIRWTDARGAELTLTGSASKERLERIRRLLGY
jgi:hypothetical protein